MTPTHIITSFWSRRLGPAAALAFLVVGWMAASAQEGAYTSKQADRGNEVFRIQCAACHGNSLVDAFKRYSNARTFFHFISGAMPRHAPGSLTEQEYVDLVAYFLERAEFPAGVEELTVDRAKMEEIIIKQR